MNKIDISNLINEYDNLSHLIKNVRDYQDWKKFFVFQYLDLLIQDPTTLNESAKEKYDHLITIYRHSSQIIKELHSKALYLKDKGMDGELVKNALRMRVEPLLERRIPNDIL